jgi:PKD repeat protein
VFIHSVIMRLLAQIALLILPLASMAQQHNGYRPCDTDNMWKQAVLNDSRAADRNAQLRAFREQFLQQYDAYRVQQGATVLYRIPVVFHIIHTYGPENISRAQVLDAVNSLNLSFQKLNPDTGVVVPLFQPIFANSQIEFVLPNLDPAGNCTDGITRTYSTLTGSASDNVKALIDWPSNQYFNIWVVRNIASGAAGYAYYPGISASIDGVVMRHDYTGSFGTSSSSNYTERSLTHEAGHWLDLPHTWGSTNTPGDPNNCNSDDGISDTPNTIGVDDFSCNTSQVTCSTVDNVQNYMDYASCHYMFTEGQKGAMHAALNSPIGGRNNLWQPANLLLTGTEAGHVVQECAPKADFDLKKRQVCAGSSLAFKDVSWRGVATQRTWYFPGGTPSTDTSAAPIVTYNTPGLYDVILVVANANGSDSLVRSQLVRVIATPGQIAVPYAESFETIAFPGTDWFIENPDQNNAWSLSTITGATGTRSVRLVNQSGNASGSVDALITPTFDLSNSFGTQLGFKVAFAPKNSTDSSFLKVYVSNNCGNSWLLRYTKIGTALHTAPPTSGPFFPSASQWMSEVINLSSTLFSGRPSIMLKFEFTNERGNNIYLDDINISAAVGMSDINASRYDLELWPNPSSGTMRFRMNLSNSMPLSWELRDASGRICAQKLPVPSSGMLEEEFGAGLPAGLYVLHLHVGDEHIARRVIFTR